MIREVRIRSCDEYSFTLSPSRSRFSLNEAERKLAKRAEEIWRGLHTNTNLGLPISDKAKKVKTHKS